MATMRRFFIFAALWAVLFGPGHVLAACPMASAPDRGAHAPCHSDADGAKTVDKRGHECCAWLAPSGAVGKFFTQKSDGPSDDSAIRWVATPAILGSSASPLTHPPPLRHSPYAILSAGRGSETFLRTGRLRL
jgi:hypothetical protein